MYRKLNRNNELPTELVGSVFCLIKLSDKLNKGHRIKLLYPL
mgnify:CR=1 FL=1